MLEPQTTMARNVAALARKAQANRHSCVAWGRRGVKKTFLCGLLDGMGGFTRLVDFGYSPRRYGRDGRRQDIARVGQAMYVALVKEAIHQKGVSAMNADR